MKDKSKQWWRWLLFIPVGIGTMILIYLIWWLLSMVGSSQFFDLDDNVISPVSIGLWVLPIIAQTASVYGSVRIASEFSPNEKIGGIIYSSLMVVLFLVLSIIWLYKEESSIQNILANILSIGMGVYAFIKLLRRKYDNRTNHKQSKSL